MTNSRSVRPHRVYCAGPLFNQAERTEMTEIANRLRCSGFEVYVPHDDGMEFRLVLHELIQRGWDSTTAGSFLHAAIFALDVYQLVEDCQSVVWNLNGRTPDEGAVSEAAIAWTLGKPIVAYKEDVRSLIAGRDNPLLAGLVEFNLVRDMDSIPDTLKRLMTKWEDVPPTLDRLPKAVQKAVGQGSLLWSAMCEQQAMQDNEALADVVEELFAPRANEPAASARE